ncbi:MAG: dihydroorotate dehydrogenase (quinone), partial [Gramella sp.]|nr:dihydroorotate dehydrogenase (quinone) [Christiangramia sp.]
AFPIIGVGGIHTADDAIEKLEAGASLVQLYTGFVYEGPALIKEINNKILEKGL